MNKFINFINDMAAIAKITDCIKQFNYLAFKHKDFLAFYTRLHYDYNEYIASRLVQKANSDSDTNVVIQHDNAGCEYIDYGEYHHAFRDGFVEIPTRQDVQHSDEYSTEKYTINNADLICSDVEFKINIDKLKIYHDKYDMKIDIIKTDGNLSTKIEQQLLKSDELSAYVDAKYKYNMLREKLNK